MVTTAVLLSLLIHGSFLLIAMTGVGGVPRYTLSMWVPMVGACGLGLFSLSRRFAPGLHGIVFRDTDRNQS